MINNLDNVIFEMTLEGVINQTNITGIIGQTLSDENIEIVSNLMIEYLELYNPDNLQVVRAAETNYEWDVLFKNLLHDFLVDKELDWRGNLMINLDFWEAWYGDESGLPEGFIECLEKAHLNLHSSVPNKWTLSIFDRKRVVIESKEIALNAILANQ